MQERLREKLRGLLERRSEHGFVSVFLDIDRGERGDRWRIELRDGLRRLLDEAEDGGSRQALEATCKRVLERFPDDAPPPPGRFQVGFVEVSPKPAWETWSSSQVGAGTSLVEHAPHPLLRPLVRYEERIAARPVVAVTGDVIRAWRYEGGVVEPRGVWELELFSGDWRERKAQAPPNPARAQSVSASGRDLFEQRLEAQRERFLREAAGALSRELASGGWGEPIVFGDPPHLEEFLEALGGEARAHAIEENVIHEPEGPLEARIEAAVEELLSRRDRELVEQVSDAALAHGGRGVSGLDETAVALAEGRAEHLVFSEALSAAPEDLPSAAAAAAAPDADGEVEAVETLIALALRSAADVTEVRGDAAAALDAHGGVAALLRYA